MLSINPNFANFLTQSINSEPKEITLDSPYLSDRPVNEEEACRASFHTIVLIFKNIKDGQYAWEVEVRKSHENTSVLKGQAHFVLHPEFDKEDMFEDSAKTQGCYHIKVKKWVFERGTLELPQSIEELSKNIFESILIDPRVGF